MEGLFPGWTGSTVSILLPVAVCKRKCLNTPTGLFTERVTGQLDVHVGEVRPDHTSHFVNISLVGTPSRRVATGSVCGRKTSLAMQ